MFKIIVNGSSLVMSLTVPSKPKALTIPKV
jgi:hypothetical protein